MILRTRMSVEGGESATASDCGQDRSTMSRLADAQSSNVQSDGARLAVHIWGTSGDVVLLLHGGPGCPDYLEPVARCLSNRFRAVTYDQRGVGASPAVGGFELADYVADVEAIRCHVGVEAMHVFGHSWGGLLAQLYANEHPERVTSLVLANSAAGVGEQWKQTEREVLTYNRHRSGLPGFAALGFWAAASRLPGRAGEVAGRHMLARVWRNYFPDPAAAPPADAAWLSGARSSVAIKTVAAVRRASASRLDGLGSRLAAPVLVVYGDDDIYETSPEHVRTRFPNAQHAILDHCGHLPWIQGAEAFAALLSGFYAADRIPVER